MDHETIQQQTALEAGTMAQVANALRAAIEWRVKPKQLARKISSVRFVAQSFQRYLDRLFSLEEHDGYMSLVIDQLPNKASRIDELKAQHSEFRQTIRRITTHLDRLLPDERATFENLCRDLLDLIKKVEKHNARETSLLQEVFTQEDGSSGD